MAVTYGFFNSVNGDRKYNADQISEYFEGIVSQGVFQSLDSGMAVSAGTGLTVNVAAGRAIVQNHWIKNDATLTLDISAASTTYARIDAVVLRFSSSNRNITIAVKTGTPAASPSAPSMTRSGGTYEMALAYVNVAANATSVTVTDKRSDTSVCGWAAVAQSIDGTYEAMIDDIKTGFDGVVYQSPGDAVRSCDTKLQNNIDDTTRWRIENDRYIGAEFYSDLLVGGFSSLVADNALAKYIIRNQELGSYGRLFVKAEYISDDELNTNPIIIQWKNSSGTVIDTSGVSKTLLLRGAILYAPQNATKFNVYYYFESGGIYTGEIKNFSVFLTNNSRHEYNYTKVFNRAEQMIQNLYGSLYSSKLVVFKDILKQYDAAEVTICNASVSGTQKTLHFQVDSISDDEANDYPIGVKQFDSNNTQIANDGFSKTNLLRGTTIQLLSNCDHYRIWSYFNSGSTYKGTITNLIVFATEDGVVKYNNAIEGKTYTCYKDGSGDYSSLVSAIQALTQIKNAKLIVGPGIWDVIDEFGSDYMSTVSSSKRGLYLKNGIHIIFSSNSKVTANYTGDNANVKTWFSLFNTGIGGFTLENCRAYGKNIRYLIHDERDQDTDAYLNRYLNCYMYFDNSENTEWTSKAVIGGGLGTNGYIDIDGCEFESVGGYAGIVSYHNSAATGRSELNVKNCYFHGNGSFRMGWYGTSTEKTIARVSGCSLGVALENNAETPSAPNENTEIIEWNNIVRNS